MVDREYKPIVPAGKRYTLPNGELRTSGINKPYPVIARTMPDGTVRPLVSMFPDMPYYGFLLVGAAEPVVNTGFSDDGINVVQQNRIWSDEPNSSSYPAHTDRVTSTKQIYFDDGLIFSSTFWLKSTPLIREGYSGGMREFYMPSRAYAHVDQKMYCLREYDTAGNPKILGYMQEFIYDQDDQFRYRSYKLQIQGEIKKSVYTHNYNPYPVSYLDWAFIQMWLWPYDADGNFMEHQSTVKPALSVSGYINTNDSYDYKIAGPAYYKEQWQHLVNYKTFYEPSKPVKAVAFDGNNGNLGFRPVAFLAGKVIEATRSCIYKQGEIAAGRAGQGFCKKSHKVLYYKIPIQTGIFETRLPTPPCNVVYRPGDIIIEETPPTASKNYRSFKCLGDDLNLQKFKSPADRPFYYTQIWQGQRSNGYQDTGFNDTTQGHCPYGSAWNEYFEPATDEQIESYVMSRHPQEIA